MGLTSGFSMSLSPWGIPSSGIRLALIPPCHLVRRILIRYQVSAVVRPYVVWDQSIFGLRSRLRARFADYMTGTNININSGSCIVMDRAEPCDVRSFHLVNSGCRLPIPAVPATSSIQFSADPVSSGRSQPPRKRTITPSPECDQVHREFTMGDRFHGRHAREGRFVDRLSLGMEAWRG